MKRIIAATTTSIAAGIGSVCSLSALAQDAAVTAPVAAETATTTESPDAAPPAASGTPDAASQSQNPATAAEPLASIPLAPEAMPKPASEAPKPDGLSEVIVTARRVAESQQDVPVAITAMSAEDLEREKITTAQDLQGRVPSLVISANSQQRNTEVPSIRGQGATYGSSPGVIIYYGEVALPTDPNGNTQGGPGKFFDLSNMQVLKGSQGTLFGRNTTGGALLLEPHKPDETFGASLKAGLSSYSGTNYEGVVNIPLVDDTLLMRAGGQYMDRDGFTHDVASGKDYDNKHYWTSRLGVTWRPVDSAENYLLGYYTDSSDNGTGTVLEDINISSHNGDFGLFGHQGCITLFLGGDPSCGRNAVEEQRARDVRHIELSADPDDILKTGAVIDQFNLELTDEMRLRNIASYSSFKHHFRWDLDGSRLALQDQTTPDNVYQADIDTYTEELQLQGTTLNGDMTYVVGVYYEHSDAVGMATQTVQVISNVVQNYSQTKDSYAPFAQGTYDLGGLFDTLAGLKFTLGARYTSDKTSGQGSLVTTITNPLFALFTPAPTEHGGKVEDSALTYTAGLDYKLDDNLFYGKISRGYKSGGIGLIAANPAHFTFKPEYVLNYEIGSKSDFHVGSMPARFNAAAYYTDYTDLQKTGPDLYNAGDGTSVQYGGGTVNAGQAWIAGFELESTIQPFRGFTLAANYSYTEAKYQDFKLEVGSNIGQVDCSGEVKKSGETADLACIPFQSAPKNQFSVNARYLLPIDASFGDVEASVTYAWTDKQYAAQYTVPEREPGAWLPSYGLLNASITWMSIFGSAFEMQLYGTNLTDETYRISNSNVWDFSNFRSSIYSEPRIVGVQIGYHWQ